MLLCISFQFGLYLEKKALFLKELHVNICMWLTSNSNFQSQKGSRSKNAGQEVSSSWAGAEDLKKVEEELDSSMDPSSSPSRWKASSSSSPSQAQGQYEDAGQKAAALAQMSQTGSWRRGMTAQVGITPPRTKGASAALKSPGRKTDKIDSIHQNFLSQTFHLFT